MKRFKKEEFSEKLSKITKTYKSLTVFARTANISPSYISKLINLKYEKAPGIEIVKRIADNSNDIVTYAQLMRICGYADDIFDEPMIIAASMKNPLDDISDMSEHDIELLRKFIEGRRAERALRDNSNISNK